MRFDLSAHTACNLSHQPPFSLVYEKKKWIKMRKKEIKNFFFIPFVNQVLIEVENSFNIFKLEMKVNRSSIKNENAEFEKNKEIYFHLFHSWIKDFCFWLLLWIEYWIYLGCEYEAWLRCDLERIFGRKEKGGS